MKERKLFHSILSILLRFKHTVISSNDSRNQTSFQVDNYKEKCRDNYKWKEAKQMLPATHIVLLKSTYATLFSVWQVSPPSK